MKKRIRPPDLNVERTYVSVDGDALVGVLQVFPINFELKTENGKNALRQFYQELFDTVEFPVQIYSRQVRKNLDTYIDSVRSGEGFEGFRQEYVKYCRELSQDGIVDTEHFLVVRVSEVSNSSLQELYRRLQTLASVIVGSSLGVVHVTGDALRRFVDREFDRRPVVTQEFCSTANAKSEGYRKLAYVTGFPSELDVGWLLKILRVDGLVDVTQVVNPVGVAAATRKLEQYSTKLRAEIGTSLSSGRHGVNNLERLVDDIDWFLDLLADQMCSPVRYGVYITIHGETREKVRETFKNLVSRLNALRLEFSQPGLRNDHAYRTDSIFYTDRLKETFLMPSLSAATGFPFGTQPFEDNGVLYGIDVEEKVPVLLDRFTWSSHSMSVTGIVGSGKSYMAHLELIRSALVYPGLRVVIVDPKKEYSSTVEALGGEQRLIEQGKEYSFDNDILSFEPVERGEFENIPALVELLRQIYSDVSKDTRETLVLVDEAHNILDDDTGRTVLRKFVLEARDINTAVHMISQGASHFTKYREGKEILDQVAGELFFREKEVTDSMIDYYNLSDRKMWRLQNLRIGEEGVSEALIHVDDIIDTRIRILSTDMEHQVIEGEQEQGLEVVR